MTQDAAKRFLLALPPVSQAPPFVHAALQGSPNLSAILANLHWTPHEVESWWQLVVVLARPDLREVHNWARSPRVRDIDPASAEILEGRLHEMLGRALPVAHRDIARLKGLLNEPRQNLDTDVFVALPQLGEEGFWDWRGHQIVFHRHQVVIDNVVDAFARLPPARRLQELDKGWVALAENMTLFPSVAQAPAPAVPSSLLPYLRQVHEAAPAWPHWRELLDLYVHAGAKHRVLSSLRAELAQEALEASLPAGGVNAPSRPRM